MLQSMNDFLRDIATPALRNPARRGRVGAAPTDARRDGTDRG